MNKIELNRWYYRDNDNETNPCTLFFLIDEDKEYFNGFTIEEDGCCDAGFEKPYFLEDFNKCNRIEFIEDKIIIHSQTELIIFNILNK